MPQGRGERAAPVLATAVSLSVLAAQLRYSDDVLAGRWFAEVRFPWVDHVADQRLGAVVVAGAAALLLGLVAAAWRARVRPLPPVTAFPTRPGPGGREGGWLA